MKTNSTFKMLRNLLLLVVGILGFAVNGWTIERTGITIDGGSNIAVTYENCYVSVVVDGYGGYFKIERPDNFSGFTMSNSTGLDIEKVNDWRGNCYWCPQNNGANAVTIYIYIDGSTVYFTKGTAPSCGPAISLSLANFSICPGETFTLSPISNITGTENYTVDYKWYRGEESSVLTSGVSFTTSLTETTEFTIYAQVTDNDTHQESEVAELNVTVTVEDSDPLDINDIEGCQGSEATVTLPSLGRNIYYHDGASGTYSSYTTSSSYAWGTFPSSGSETMCFAVQDGKGHFCQEKCITKSPRDYLSIATQPLASQDVCQSASPTNLTVTPSVCGGNGSEVYSYQWYKNTTRSTSGATIIEGATNATYTPPTEEIGTTYYFCKVTINSYTKYTDISSVSVVGSPAPPVIEDASVGNDKNFVIPVEAEYYQSDLGLSWVKKTINSEVGKLYNNHGDYVFKARSVNAAGCHSEEVNFHVYSLYNVDVVTSKTTFENQTLCIGATATQWSVQGKGEWGMDDLTYTWKKSSTNNISEAVDVSTGKTFTPSTMDAPGTYYYWCVIGSSSHSDKTHNVGFKTLTINGPSALQIEDVSVCPNNDIVFNTDVNMSSYTVSVLRGGAAQTITKGDNTLTIAAANVTQSENSTETYTFRTSSNGCTLEETADVTIKDGNEILLTTDITNKSITTCKDETVSTLSVAGESCASLTYQWYENSVNSTTGATAISGATSATYVPSSATAGTKYYFCEITNGVNTVVSSISKVAILDVSISFDETEYAIPASVFCSQEIPVAVKVTIDGVDSTKRYGRFWWTNNGVSDGLSAVKTHTFSFNCANAASYPDPLTLQAYIVDDAFGCQLSVSKTVSVKGMSHVYYYWGPTGSSSALNDSRYWSTCSSFTDPDELDDSGNPMNFYNATKSYSIAKVASLNTYNSCVSPSNFSENGCQYIVNKDDVELLSNQIWTVSGEGSKITVGTDHWDKEKLPVAGTGWVTETNSYDYMDGQYFEFASASMNGKNQVERLTTVASYDYRDYAKTFKIYGTLNTNDDVKLNVNNGTTLTIATDEGTFKLGELATDEITSADGNSNGYYNVCVKPAASVTYVGDGTKKIREAVYSQLYIEPTNSTDTIIFEQDATIEVLQVLDLSENATYEKINHNNTTIIFDGVVNQNIPSMPYYILELENQNNKILNGDVSVASSLIIGAGSSFIAGDNIITIDGRGKDAVVYNGIFECGTSTVKYNNADATTVAAMDYYNLDLGEGDRTLATENNIGVAGLLTTDTESTYSVTGSTVEFNGTSTQMIPAFTFYNLVLNNTAMSGNSNDFFDDTYYIRMLGNVVVENEMRLSSGILNVNDKTLSVQNTSVDAIGQGFFDSFKSASFIVGDVERLLPSNQEGTDRTSLYYFPVGDVNGYKPLTLSRIITGSEESSVIVGISGAVNGTFVDGGSNDSFSSAYSWKVEGNNYIKGSVGISSSSGIGEANAIAYNTSNSGSFTNVYGSTSGNSILYSLEKAPGYFALANRTITSKKYYYNCNGAQNPSDITSWYTQENGGGVQATNFSEADVEWIFNCSTTIESPLTIDGSNSKVTMNIPQNDSLIINSAVSFITASIKQGAVKVKSEGELSVLYSFSMRDVSSGGDGINIYNRSSIYNEGTVNIYNSTVVLTDSWITNRGRFNMTNSDLTLTSKSLQGIDGLLKNFTDNDSEWMKSQGHTCFWNMGTVVMKNGSLDVNDDGGAPVVHMQNASNAVWLIDNSISSGVKHVTFDGCELNHGGKNIAYVDMQCGSSFVVKNSDVQFLYKGNTTADIGGEMIVEDGNLYIARSDDATGGTFTLEQTCGTMFLIDTDGSGDGVLELKGAGGGYSVNIEGTMYAMGVVESGGNGAALNIKDKGKVFIGNLGATVPAYTWNFSINVEKGGTLYYCGNRTSGADGVGTNAGSLYYAGSFYGDDDPISQLDFSDDKGLSEPMFVGEMDCMMAYNSGLPNTDNATLLPVELTMLYGVCDDNDVILRWQTASETNSSHFVILRSFNGIDFEEVDIIGGAGTTTSFHNYDYVDSDIEKQGIVYYKLRQVDYDGNYTDSKVIAVQTCGKNAHFSFYADEIDISFANPEQSNYVIITSITGQIFYSKSFRNVEEARIAAPQRKGIYIISVIDSKQITSEKFIR